MFVLCYPSLVCEIKHLKSCKTVAQVDECLSRIEEVWVQAGTYTVNQLLAARIYDSSAPSPKAYVVNYRYAKNLHTKLHDELQRQRCRLKINV